MPGNSDEVMNMGVLVKTSLKNKLHVLAAKEDRSLSSYCRRIIETAVADIESKNGEIKVPVEA